MFFHETCKSIFNHLLRAELNEREQFGQISIYFRTVKTNGRRMLYLHCLARLKEISGFANLRKKVVQEEGF